MIYTKQHLKELSISHSLFPQTSLKEAFNTLKFVQMDPIRSPARAQDLMLRHRVKNYLINDIDKLYGDLDLEEDFLYAHGYMTRDIANLLYPRLNTELTQFDQTVLATIKTLDEIHPKDLELYFEKKREVNWWGGYSRASKMSLERLHYYGLIRVLRRQNGIRVYKASSERGSDLSLEERLTKLLLVIIDIMSPVTSKTLSESLHRIHRHFGNTKSVMEKLFSSGQIESQEIDGLTYYWPSDVRIKTAVPKTVKFLSPFDPVVRDRVRFLHLWGWQYQFEAYVPAAKRLRGYYAMPLLYGSEIIGWTNIKRIKDELSVDVGFVSSRPKDSHFDVHLEEEILRMKSFLL